MKQRSEETCPNNSLKILNVCNDNYNKKTATDISQAPIMIFIVTIFMVVRMFSVLLLREAIIKKIIIFVECSIVGGRGERCLPIPQKS